MNKFDRLLDKGDPTPFRDELKKFIKAAPPKVRDGDVPRLPKHISDPTESLVEVLNEFAAKCPSSKFSRLTVVNRELLESSLVRYRNLLRELCACEDISQNLYKLNKLVGTISPQSAFSSTMIVREVLLRWFVSMYYSIAPEENR